LSSRDNQLWIQAWRKQLIDFHQTKANNLLTQFWPKLSHSKGSRVLVPLCGKSLDMIWLAQQGHQVIGVELSPIAVETFFTENNLKPVKRRNGKFNVWKNGNISILCGDYFALTQSDIGHIDMVYDRAALTALSAETRRLYAIQLRMIIPKTCEIFLLTIEDFDKDQPQNLLAGIDLELNTLFSKDYHITLTHSENASEETTNTENSISTSSKYKVYHLAAC